MEKDNIKNHYECSIEHFIRDEYSICREERQYAVFLYNILRKYRNKDKRIDKEVVSIFNACSIPRGAEIQNVFYEATFMRDFFERNRRLALSKNPENILLNKKFSPSNFIIEDSNRSFNTKLIEYVIGQKQVLGISHERKEVNWGHNAALIDCSRLSDKEKKEIGRTIQHMMNAKPDIAVIYSENKQRKLLFLECKFESGERSYERDCTQSDIQWKIADFLCKYYLKEESVAVSDKMKNRKSCFVKFVRKKAEKTNEIQIKDLIRLNDEIFS